MAEPQLPVPDPDDPIFKPLEFKSGLKVKNRLFRSNISGRFDYYDGHGSEARFNWEESFAAGGVGCIISSFTPVNVRGRIIPNYAMIDHDDKIPFWSEVGRRVHEAGKKAYPGDKAQSKECKFLMQLSHSGRQQDIGGVENRYRKALSSTSVNDYFHGILCQAMTKKEIREVVQQFADGAARAKLAGLDGVELHGANGYLITQFLSSAINDRNDEYGGSVQNRARFLKEIIESIRERVGDDFHLQLKTNAEDFDNALYPWLKRGNRLSEALQICQIAVDAGADALHISSGAIFPHPRNPPGDFPLREAVDWYDTMLSSGVNARMNYRIFKSRILGPLFRWWWNLRRGLNFEDIKLGINLDFAAQIKKEFCRDDDDNSQIRVLATGGFQHGLVIRQALQSGKVDGVSMARTLVANPDLPKLFRKGMDWSDASWVPDEEWPINSRHPCTYCNKCLLNALENPLGCYEESRYQDYGEKSYEKMIETVMSVFPRPASFPSTENEEHAKDAKE